MEQVEITSVQFNDKQISIINAAELLFAERGYEGTSVRDIAHQAGVNVAMISYYFGSKEKLFESIYVYRISISKIQLETLVHDGSLRASDKINQLIENYVEKILRNPSFHRINLYGEQAKEMTRIAEIINNNKLYNLNLVKKIVEEGQRSGEFIEGIEVSMLMSTMLGTTYFMLSNLPFYQTIYHLENLNREQLHLHLKNKIIIHIKKVFNAILTHETK